MEELILAVALIIFVVALWKPASKAVAGALDSRAEKIRNELDEAQRLREEAQALLAKYERQLHDGEEQAAQIIAHAEEEAERQEKQAKADLETMVERRTQQAMDRIAQAEARALAEVRGAAASVSVQATERLLREGLTGERAGSLIDDAVGEVRQKLAS
ncbi:MAG: F0F1 ATP synthase subunit B [Geminicoccaceae bacterium]